MKLKETKMLHSDEIIRIIAEQLTNEFPGVKIDNVMDKARRLYNIMKLEKSMEELEKDKEVAQVERILKELKEMK